MLLAPSVWKPEMLLNISRAAPRPATVKNHLAQTVSADAEVSEDLGPVVPSTSPVFFPKKRKPVSSLVTVTAASPRRCLVHSGL